jgi:hypothetical protein
MEPSPVVGEQQRNSRVDRRIRRWTVVVLTTAVLLMPASASPALAHGYSRTRRSSGPAAVKVTDSAFRWLDAAVGAATALGVVAVLSAARRTTYRPNNRTRQEESR